MASLNKVFLMGNLTRDPELRYTPSGTAVANFSIAINSNYTTQNGEKREDTTFVRVVVWGRQAENCNEYLSKGRPVFVEGRLQSRSWDAPDGTRRSAMDVIAQRVQFLARASSADSTRREDHVSSTVVSGAGSEIPVREYDGDIPEDDIPF